MKDKRQKVSGYQMGAIKRKLGIKKAEKLVTGDLIKKMNAKKRISIMGLI